MIKNGSAIFALLLLALSSALAVADDLRHPGILMGIGHEDLTGDSPYHPVAWCEDLLWIERGGSVSLLDPSTQQSIWHFRDIGWSQGFLGCHSEGGIHIVWTDADGTLAWRTYDDKQIGTVVGVAHDYYRGKALIDFVSGLTMIVAEDRDVHFINKPPGHRIVTLSKSDLGFVLSDSHSRCEGPGKPELLGADFLSAGLIMLRTVRSVPISGGTGAPTRCEALQVVTVATVEIRGDRVAIKQHWNLHELDQSLTDLPIVNPIATPKGHVEFDVGWPAFESCELDVAAQPPQIVCHNLIPSAYPYGPRIKAAERINRFAVIETSPSGEWTAWTETADDEQNTARIYLARTSDVLLRARIGSAGGGPR